MDQKLIEIIGKAHQVFMRYGLKSVTMDDIARELKMSKKTLYKYVSDKNDLLTKAMTGYCQMEVSMVDNIIEQDLNAIDEILAIGKHVSAQLKQMNPSIHFDMVKYYPEVWTLMENHRDEFIGTCVTTNLEKGIKEGLYRDNLNVKIITKLYLSKIDMVFDAAIFPVTEFNFADVYQELMRYHIRGIASKKGVEYLKQMNNENLNFYND